MISIAFSIMNLVVNLLFLWIMFGWRVRKARGAFERELVLQGMRKEDAKRISAQYSKLKESLMGTLKMSLR